MSFSVLSKKREPRSTASNDAERREARTRLNRKGFRASVVPTEPCRVRATQKQVEASRQRDHSDRDSLMSFDELESAIEDVAEEFGVKLQNVGPQIRNSSGLSRKYLFAKAAAIVHAESYFNRCQAVRSLEKMGFRVSFSDLYEGE